MKTRPCVLVPLLFVVGAPSQEVPWLAKVEARILERVQRPDAVGFSVGIAQHGRIVLAKGYGLGEVEHAVPATSTMPFRIGSITKQFTAALILRLVEQQRLALDDDLSKYVPQFPLQGRKVTIRQLLHHTSGIPSYTDLGPEWASKQPLELSHDELLGLVAGKPFDFEPGTDWHYDNTGYYLLGMVVEKVHGAPYAKVVAELAAALQLEHTRCDDNRALIPGRAQGYDFEDGVRTNDLPLGMSQPGGAGNMISTGADLVRWSMALAGGKVVQPASYVQMTTMHVLPNGRDTGYGFGLMKADLGGRPVVMHGGGIHGFNSQLLHVVPDDLHVAVISNCSAASADELARDLTRLVLGIERAKAKDEPIPAEVLEAAAGRFEFAELEMVVAVQARDGQLFAKGEAEGQGEFRLQFQGGRVFRASFDSEVRLEFSADWKELTLAQGGGLFVGKRP